MCLLRRGQAETRKKSCYGLKFHDSLREKWGQGFYCKTFPERNNSLSFKYVILLLPSNLLYTSDTIFQYGSFVLAF